MSGTDGVCACPCHTGGAKHIAPCECSPCAYCEQPVRKGQEAAHVKGCGRRKKKPPRSRRGI